MPGFPASRGAGGVISYWEGCGARGGFAAGLGYPPRPHSTPWPHGPHAAGLLPPGGRPPRPRASCTAPGPPLASVMGGREVPPCLGGRSLRLVCLEPQQLSEQGPRFHPCKTRRALDLQQRRLRASSKTAVTLLSGSTPSILGTFSSTFPSFCDKGPFL